jgi:hypothetical protein
MAYTFSALKTKLQTQVGDANLSDSVAGDALNATEQHLFNTFDLTLNSAQQSNAVASGANTLTSSLPTDFQRIQNICITAPVGLMQSLKKYYLTPDAFRELYPSVIYTGPLQQWTYWTGVEFSTLADQDYTIKLDYTKSVPLMSASDDVPTVPQSFEELLMLGAKIRIYEQKEDFDYASQFVNRYADLVEAFTTRYSTRQIDYQVRVPSSRRRV